MTIQRPPLTEEVVARRNLHLAAAHLRAILADPALLDEIPDGAIIVDLPDDPQLAEYNRVIGMRREAEGRRVSYRRVQTSGATDAA